jgi:phosphoserine phosphatase
MNLALFDFDGTITTDDSLIKFIRFVAIKMTKGMDLPEKLTAQTPTSGGRYLQSAAKEY